MRLQISGAGTCNLARVTVLAGLIGAACAPRAEAQSLFVSASVFANVVRLGGYTTASPYVDDSRFNETGTGFGVGVGGHIGRHVVIQVEYRAPETLDKSFEGPTYLPPIPQPQFRVHRDMEYRSRHGSLLGGYRTRTTHRVSCAVLGGVMFVEERVRQVTRTVPSPPFIPSLPTDNTSYQYRMAPVFGFDLTVSAFSRLEVVPELRAYKVANGVFGLWPGVSVRWMF